MAKAIKTPIPADYYGFRFTLRIEQRGQLRNDPHPTAILAYRDDRILFEHTPFRLNGWPELNARYESLRAERGDAVPFPAEWLPARPLHTFFVSCFEVPLDASKYRAERIERCRNAEIPLAVMLSAEQNAIVLRPKSDGGARSVSSVDSELRAIRTLTEKEGRTAWREVTPSKCADWLRKETEHSERSCVRVMRELFSLLCGAAIVEENPWVGYPFHARNPGQKQAALVQRALEQYSFDHEQVGAIIERLGRSFSIARYRTVGFAVLLILCLHLETAEVCALNWDDFHYLPNFSKRLTISLTHKFSVPEGKQHSVYTELDDVLDIRQLELPMLAAVYFERMRAIGPSSGALLRAETHPDKRMTPNELENRVAEFLADFRAERAVQISGTKRLQVLKLLQNTALLKLNEYGYEDEELRYILAKPPQLVSARSYSDFAFEAAVNKRGAIQDRWLGVYLPRFLAALEASPASDSNQKESQLHAKSSGVTIAGDSPDHRANVRLRLPIQLKDGLEPPEEGLTFLLSAAHAVTGSARFIHVVDKKEGASDVQ